MIPKNYAVCRVFDYAVDYNRTMAYHDWIKDNVAGKTVVELGSGSGILTWLCVKYGATKVYSYENNLRIINWLEQCFEGESKVEIKKEDITTASFPTADIYLHENLGCNVYNENILDMYTNLKSQNLEDKCYPNKIKIQYGTYDGTSTKYDGTVNDFSSTVLKEFFDSCPMEKMPRVMYQLTPEIGKITINGTLYDGYFKNLTRYTDSDANSEYIFWEASFDGNQILSNWKSKNTWQIIKAADEYLLAAQLTYSIE